MTSCKIIGVAGGSGSGKTTFAKALQECLGTSRCGVLGQDHYYVDQSHRFTGDGSVNFDHPDSIDLDLLAEHLRALKRGEPVNVPIYDFVTHTRSAKAQPFAPCSLVVVDGTLIFSKPELRECFDFRVFVDAPEQIRYERRYQRDLNERGRSPEGIERQFRLQVKPMHDRFVEPTKAHAHEVVSGLTPFAPEELSWVRKLMGK